MSRIPDNVLVFGRVLRRVGIDVPIGSMLDLLEALTLVDVGSRDEVFHTCRAILVSRHEQLPAFAVAFDAFWRDYANPFASTAPGRPRDDRGGSTQIVGEGVTAAADADDPRDDPGGDIAGTIAVWSEQERLAHKDFAEFTSDEIVRARAVIDRLDWIPGYRRTRRWVPGRGRRIDLRKALARSLRTGGDLAVLPRRHRQLRPRPLVLLCDVSGSMERYSRMLLHFAYGMGRRGRLEAFVFSTGLTRVTRELRYRRLDDAAGAVSRAVPDWSGGTRIGAALQQFHQRWSRRVLHQQPVVMLISDGWDRGDPAVLAAQIARLQRSSHRLIWLNPLIGTLDYAPLTRALQAALPFVDDFLPARTLTDLASLAVHLRRL